MTNVGQELLEQMNVGFFLLMLTHKTTKLLPEFVFQTESPPHILHIQLSVNGESLYSLEKVSHAPKSSGLYVGFLLFNSNHL